MMQCIVYNTPVPVALECSGSTLARQGMYKRIAQWGSSLASANLACIRLRLHEGLCHGVLPHHPIMSRMSALTIVKVLMPKVAPTLKLADYTTLKTCTKWLGELAGGTTWVDEMKAMEEGNELNPTAH